MSVRNLSRRDMLAGSISAGIGLAGGCVWGSREQKKPGEKFRIAHLTDLHIHSGPAGIETERAVRHALSHQERPQMIVTGGDLIFDAMARGESSVARQWHHFHKVFDQDYRVRIEHIIGNHDIWGVNQKKCGTTGKESRYGKRWAMDELRLDRIYRSFEAGGWHWILLDDIQPLPEKASYEARLDEEQFAWLAQDLKGTDPSTPVAIVSHAPILCSSVFFLPLCNDKGRWDFPFMLMNADTRRLTELFEQHGNVKLCLSGHTHLVDKVAYKGVTYLGHGAVCGNWWQGPFQGFEPGYALIDLYPDGTIESQYCTYSVA